MQSRLSQRPVSALWRRSKLYLVVVSSFKNLNNSHLSEYKENLDLNGITLSFCQETKKETAERRKQYGTTSGSYETDVPL